MQSHNPVLTRANEFSNRGYATFDSAPSRGYGTPSDQQLQDMYAAPPATSRDTGRMTLDDVVMRTATVFGLLVVAAAATWFLEPNFGIVLLAMVVGLVLGLVNSFKKNPSPALILAYAAFEGVFVGGISLLYEDRWHGIVAQAVLGTLAAFAAMLALYRFKVIQATPRFRRVLIIAAVGYLVFGLVNLLGSLFGVWTNVYSSGPLAILLSAAGVVLASLFLILDFDFVEQGIRNGIPAKYAWTAAFGLVVTIVWLYLEMLRLLSILQGRN
jgi:uncharacterized YccA/Bax inhibitor family protein